MRPRLLIAVAVAALASLTVLTTLVAVRWAPLVRFDAAISERARRYGEGHPGWVTALRLVTDTGAGGIVLVAGIVVAAALLIMRRYRDLAFLGLGAAATHLLLPAIGYSVRRPRPVHGFVHYASPSFPSAHTVHASTAALLGLLLFWPHLRRTWLRVVAITAAVLWAGVVGGSRVALLAHWPTDVLGGLLVALGLVPLAAVVARRLPVRAPGRAASDAAGSAGPG